MTTEGEQAPAEQQEAVCVKCGEPESWAGHRSLMLRDMVPLPSGGYFRRHPFIPAPVVRSYDRRRCVHSGCGVMAEEHFALQHDFMAPPTPSQDAEGEQQGAVCGTCGGTEDAMYDATGGALLPVHPDVHPFIQAPVVPSDEPETRRVVFYSGGKASFLAAHRAIERYGVDGVTLLFTDTLIEDADLYRFLAETSAALGVDVTRLADGRTPWQVFTDKRFLGNNRVPLCSRVLKQEVAQRWVVENCDPANTVLYFGIDWTEEHRMSSIRRVWGRWTCESPLLWEPLVEKNGADDLLARFGIEQPRLYALGASHNNCGGLCVRAGQGAFAWALKALPDVYAEWERNEERLRDTLGDVSILRDRRGGETRTLPLSELRARVQEKPEQVDMFDIGGCGCFVEDGEDADA